MQRTSGALRASTPAPCTTIPADLVVPGVRSLRAGDEINGVGHLRRTRVEEDGEGGRGMG